MTWLRPFLVAVVIGELLVGAGLAVMRSFEPTPPTPDFSAFNPVTASALKEAATKCETPAQWAELGELYIAHGYFLEAEACLREASARQPRDADLMFKHAFALERFFKLDEANARYKEAIQYGHVRVLDIHYNIAHNLQRKNQDEAARDEYEKAGALLAGLYEQARIDIRTGQLDRAEQTALALARAHPRTAQPASLLFRVAIARDDRLAARRYADQFDRKPAQLPAPFDVDFQRLIDLHDQFGIAAKQKQLAKLLGGSSVKEAEALADSILAAEWTPTVADQRAEIDLRQGRHREAIARLEDAMKRDGPTAGLLERLGDALRESGDSEKARSTWERASTLGTGMDLKNIRHKLALSYEQAGRADVANTYHGLAALSAGIEQFEAGRFTDAELAFTEATRRNAKLAHAWFYFGECYRLTNRPTEAKAAYEKCLQLNPDHGRALRGQSLLP